MRGGGISATRKQHRLLQEYDFYQFETDLRDRLLRGTAPVAIALRHFQYSGELRATGQLRLFAQRIPQQPLPPSTLETIVSEIDTRQRLTGEPGINPVCYQITTHQPFHNTPFKPFARFSMMSSALVPHSAVRRRPKFRAAARLSWHNLCWIYCVLTQSSGRKLRHSLWSSTSNCATCRAYVSASRTCPRARRWMLWSRGIANRCHPRSYPGCRRLLQ